MIPAGDAALGRALVARCEWSREIEFFVPGHLLQEREHQHAPGRSVVRALWIIFAPGGTGRAPLDNVAGREHAVRRVVVVQRQGQLPELVAALQAACGFAGALHRRQQQGNEDADDGDDHEQFHEGEAAFWILDFGCHDFVPLAKHAVSPSC
jgi:hypothetical protein